MKKLLILVSIVALTFAFASTSMAFLDDNSVDNSTNADASATGVGNGVVGDINSGNTNEAAKIPASMGEWYNPGMPTFIGQVPAGFAYMPLSEFILYKDTFNAEEIAYLMKSMPKGKYVMPRPFGPEVKEEDRPAQVKIMTNFDVDPQAKSGYVSKGVVIVAAKDIKSVTPDVAAAIMAEARKYGADTIDATGQGVHRRNHSGGWGIGFGGLASNVNSDGTATLVQGGTGFNKGTAYHHDHPWLQVHMLKKVD
jgi:hypothetical protein